jgi:hypothetical protein
VPVVPALGTAGIPLSDHPLVLRSSRTGSRVGVGWGNSDAIASMPLCPTSFLVLLYSEAGCISQGEANAEDVDFLNLETIRFANREVYSRFNSKEAHNWMMGSGRRQQVG